MPTENRSSNTEMVSVPREVIEFAAGLKWHGHKSGTDQKDDQLQALKKLRGILEAPAPQPHADPIAWMVGTAIWWTKEEAERDAAAIGLAVIPVGPMTDAREVELLKRELLVARAQGRAEVVEMIAQLDAETGLDEFIGSHAIADTGDYGCHWEEDELRKHFNADPAAASELEMCRYSSHQIIQLEREEEQLRTHITTQKSWMDRFVEYLTESGVPEDLLAEYKAITAVRI